MTLLFELRPSYGHSRYYPMNVGAKSIVKLADRVCLEHKDLVQLALAGFDIQFSNAIKEII